MRLTIQRVKKASVTVDKEIVGQIGYGILVLLGFGKHDTDVNIKKAAQKILKIRLWETIKNESIENQKIKTWATNVMQNKYDVLVVSQFTLYGYMNGNKPDFHNSMGHEKANEYYEKFVQILRESYPEGKIQTGAFGKHMDVELLNDGPVTFNLEYEG
jgi:D-tyrosyl-tRNA(Tyr) deacylase